MEITDEKNKDRDDRLHNYDEGVILMSKDEKEIKIPRKLAIYSEILQTTIEESSESKEDRKGWTENQYKNEPFIQIEIPIPFSEKFIRIIVAYLDSLDNLDDPMKEFDLDSYKLTDNELIELMKIANWFILDNLSSLICSNLVKFYQDKPSMEQIKPFNPKPKITRYYSGRMTDTKTNRDDLYLEVMNKFMQSGYEYVLFNGGYFVGTDAHFENDMELIKMGLYFPNVVSKYPEIKETKTQNIQYGVIRIIPYTYVYGRISLGGLVADFKSAPAEFKDLLPSPGRTSYINIVSDNSFTNADSKDESDQERFISYLKSNIRSGNMPDVIATRREIYESKTIPKISSLPYDQRIVMENLIHDKNFVTDYIPMCLRESYSHEYKCVPVYTGDILSFSNWGYNSAYEEFQGTFVFGSYAIMFLGNITPWNNNKRSIVMDTNYPGKNYLISQHARYNTLVPIDTTRFLLKNSATDFSSVECYDFKDLTEGKILNPYCVIGDINAIHTQILRQTPRLFTGEEKKQYFTLNRPVQRCSGYVLSSGGVFFSVDDGLEIGRFSSAAHIDIASISIVGNYIVIKGNGINKYYLTILNIETLQIVFADESQIKGSLGTTLNTDNSNIIVAYKYVGSSANEFKTMIITIIDKGNVVKQQNREFEFITDTYLENGNLIDRGIENDPSVYSPPYSEPVVKFNIGYNYKPLSNETDDEKLEHYWTEKLFGRLVDIVDADQVSHGYFNSKMPMFKINEISYNTYFYPIGGRDCIIVLKESGFAIPGTPEKMKCYKYSSPTDTIVPLNCEGGRIIEVPSTQKLVVEYGYSGFCEIWI